MPYNKSYGTIRRMRDYLERMRVRRGDISFPAENPRSLAYKLREAMYAAQFHKEKGDHYEDYANLRHFYELQEKPGRVVCRWLGEPTGHSVEEGEPSPKTEAPPMQVDDATTLTNIVGALLKYEEVADEIQFPNAALDNPDKARLLDLAHEKGWEIIDHDEAGLTLTQRNVPEAVTLTKEQL